MLDHLNFGLGFRSEYIRRRVGTFGRIQKAEKKCKIGKVIIRLNISKTVRPKITMKTSIEQVAK